MASSETILSSKDIEDLLNNSNLSFENLKYLAKEVANNSWSPYSHFPVGAVVVGIDQNKKLKTFPGTNVEPNIPLTLCAERNAIYSGITAGYKKFVAIAISLPKAELRNEEKDLNFFTPCGACREVISQKIDSKGIILIDGIQRTFTPKELLPHPILDVNKLKTLTLDELDTLERARTALHNAHVPFSKEKYAVAMLVENPKEIYSACTVDSYSFGLSVEPAKAVFGSYFANRNLKNKIKAVIFAFPFVKYPPGDALQIISDHTEPNTKIIIDNVGITTIEELLPFAFKF